MRTYTVDARSKKCVYSIELPFPTPTPTEGALLKLDGQLYLWDESTQTYVEPIIYDHNRTKDVRTSVDVNAGLDAAAAASDAVPAVEH